MKELLESVLHNHAKVISIGTVMLLCIYQDYTWKSLSIFATFLINNLKYYSKLYCNTLLSQPTAIFIKSLHLLLYEVDCLSFTFYKKSFCKIKGNFEENFIVVKFWGRVIIQFWTHRKCTKTMQRCSIYFSASFYLHWCFI